jgi:protease II
MKPVKSLSTLLFLLAWILLCASIQAQTRVEDLLSQVDTWIIDDTTRILEYIDSCNAHTDSVLKSSRFWADTYRDLCFLLSIDYAGGPQIDNTGRIYFTMRITGESEALFYVDSPMSWPHQLTPNNWTAEGLTIGYFDVHPSGNYVLVGVMKHGNENFDVYLFERDGSFRPLLQDERIQYYAIVFLSEDEFFLNSSDRKNEALVKYTISTGRLDTLYTEREVFYPLDYADGKLLLNRWFSFSESQLFIYDATRKKTKDITKRGLYWGGVFTSENQILSLTSGLSSENEFMKFALLDLEKPKKLRLVFDPGREVDDYTFIRGTGVTFATLNMDGYSELVAFDLRGKPRASPQPEIGVVENIFSNDYGEVVYDFSSPRMAPSAFYFRSGDAVPKKVASVPTFGFDFSNIKVDLVRYRSTDGVEIPALLYVPENAERDGNNPAVVVYHGGPPAQSRPYFQRNVAFALSRGLVMLFPNVRGSTGYGPAYEEADNLEGREQSLEDCFRALDYLVEERWSNPERIAIWGASYGGYVVNYLAVRFPQKFRCGISEVGVSDVDYTNTHADVTFQRGWEKEYGPIGSDLTRRLSPIFYAHSSTRPILVTAGFNDPRVFAGDPRRFGWLLSQLGKEVLYYEQVEAGHGAMLKTQVIEDYTRTYTFILEQILP